MKSIEEIVKLLENKKLYLKKKYNVKSIGVFGSYSRDEAEMQSDVDILVDFQQPIGLEFVDLAEELEEILGVQVDLVSKNGVKQKYLEKIDRDLVHV